MKTLALYLWRHSRLMTFLAILGGFLTGLCNTIAIGLINKGIEHQGDYSSALLWAFGGVCIVLPLTRVMSQIFLTKLSQKLIFDLRLSLARRILSVPLRKLEEKGPGGLLTLLTQDITMISTGMASIPNACLSVAIVISGFAYMAFLYWPAAIAAIVTVILGTACFAFVAGRANGYLLQTREDQDTLFEQFNALIYGNKELKIHQQKRQYFMGEMLHGSSESFRKNNVLGEAWYAGAASMGQFMLFVTVGLLIFLMPVYVTDIKPAILTGYAMILMYMILPLEALTNLVPFFSRAAISLRKVEELGLALDQVTKESIKEVSPNTDWNELSYQQIVHRYYREQEDEVFTMGPIDLDFQPGELVFLIGGNGSGKTTLAKILLGLYTPESGEIRLDGTSIDDSNRDGFRQQFSAVFSDFFLFEDMMGLCPPEKEELAGDYLKRLQLSHKVTVENNRISSTELSLGQRKRLALLTSFLEDRPIYLFDEWAADQDPLFKDIFYRLILPALKERGKTVIAITHDDRYFNQADRIIKLDYGKVVTDTRDVTTFATEAFAQPG